jgi:hypothetical protein
MNRDSQNASRSANSGLDVSSTTPADNAYVPTESLPNTKRVYEVRTFRNTGRGPDFNEATITTPAPTRRRPQVNGRRHRKRLSIVMQLLARLQHLESL